MLADNPYFDNHERVLFINDQPTGLKAIIAIHSTVLGPAVGGIRMWPYDNEADALNDVLKLSRGMTLKTAIADLPLGGGKSVINQAIDSILDMAVQMPALKKIGEEIGFTVDGSIAGAVEGMLEASEKGKPDTGGH